MEKLPQSQRCAPRQTLSLISTLWELVVPGKRLGQVGKVTCLILQGVPVLIIAGP